MRPHKLTLMPCFLFFAACNVVESPMETASETGGMDTGATDGAEAGMDTGATDGSETDSDTGAPAGCEAADPGARADLVFAFDAWDEQQVLNHNVDTTCVVGESAVAGEHVTTALSCELDGVAQPASLTVSASALDQDYVAGEQVKLRSSANDASEIDIGVLRNFVMRSASDDRLLVVGMRDEDLVPEFFAPLEVEDVFACGEPDGRVPLRVDFHVPEGASVGVFSGRSDVLDAGDGVAYSIDVQEASGGNCCHYFLMHHLLVRRVKTG